MTDLANSIMSFLSSFINEKDTLSTADLTILLGTFSVLIWLIWIAKKLTKTSPPLPPGPSGLPIVGYIPFLGVNLHRIFTDLVNTYGPIYKLHLGSRLAVVVSSPELVKQIVRDQDTIFANRDPPIAAIPTTYGLSDIAMGIQGPEWTKLRKVLVREMQNHTTLDNCMSLVREEVSKCVVQVNDKIGTPVDLGVLSFYATSECVMSMIWGGTKSGILKVNKGVDVKFRETVEEIVILMGLPNVSDFFPKLGWFDFQGIEKRAKKVAQLYDVIIGGVIKQQQEMDKRGEKNGEESRGFLQFFLDLIEHEDSKKSINTNQLKGMLVDLAVASTDTTATAIEWTMAELMQNPEVLKKVQEELTEVVGLNNLVEDSHLPKLAYLSAVVKETMRLHPPLPLLIPRCSGKSTVIGGYTVPKGTKVFLNVWAIQRDPKLWDSALEFRPERFLDSSKKYDFSGNNFLFLPFGSGRRICAGVPVADRMLMYVLATMFHVFDWKLPEGAEVGFEDKFGIVLKKTKPLLAIPTPRFPN